MACRVRHWLESRSLTSERSCAHHSSFAMLPCDAMSVRGTCSMRSFPRDNVHAGRVVRSHKRRPTALLIAGLSACACEVRTCGTRATHAGTCGAQRLRMGYDEKGTHAIPRPTRRRSAGPRVTAA
jgi:hypothetical protein